MLGSLVLMAVGYAAVATPCRTATGAVVVWMVTGCVVMIRFVADTMCMVEYRAAFAGL
ncbi:MAG: hypothetical protein OXH72_10890 [Caldilineaceae bacterium]|nr:hypothetical protein [Caldilineaceae bacterium]